MAKILIVDDSVVQRRKLSRDLEAFSHNTTVASNGEEALEKATQDPPECIITDLLMPVMDGVELIRRLKAQGLEIPVIVITANNNQDKIDEVNDLGVVQILNKPYDSENLKQILNEAIGNE